MLVIYDGNQESYLIMLKNVTTFALLKPQVHTNKCRVTDYSADGYIKLRPT